MSSSRRIRAGAAAAVMAVVGSLFIVATGPTAVTQEGVNNYIGPGPCPGEEWNCEITSGDVVEAVQKAPTFGRNVVDCRGMKCHVAQSGLLETDKPTNEATCANDTAPVPVETRDGAVAQESEQSCEIHQHGGSNTINADFGAAPTVSGQSEIIQRSEQRFITTQNGDTNTLNVAGTINQQASSFLQIPVTHEQRTLQRSDNTMEATSTNVANYALTRGQISATTGTTTTQLQDTEDPPGSDPEDGTIGLGEISLVANSAGTNKIHIRGTDTKDQDSTSLIGAAIQTQGREGGGWKATLDVDSAVPNPDGPDADSDPDPDIDIGAPGSTEGLIKSWDQNAEVLPTSTRTQDQIDGIGLPLIGKSPFNVISNSRAVLVSDTDAHEVCDQDASGHAKTRWRGRLFCSLTEGNAPPVTVAVPFDATDVNASIRCEINSDSCPEGQLHPVSHSHLAVRNADADPAETFSATDDEAPSSTTAEPGETIEYKATFHNSGGAPATNASLSLPISPSGDVVGGCDVGCTAGAGSVTWSLGDVPQETAVSRTLQVKIADGTAPDAFTNQATGDDDQEDPTVNTDLVSNETTVTVVESPPVVREIQIDVLEQTINATKPKNGAANVIINDPTVVPESVCFGDLPECTTGTSLGVGNFDTDPELELKMKFLVSKTGIDPGDTQACLEGETTSGELVHGCDTIKTT